MIEAVKGAHAGPESVGKPLRAFLARPGRVRSGARDGPCETGCCQCAATGRDRRSESRSGPACGLAAREWLQTEGYDPACIDEIEHAIAAHSFSAGIRPRTIEAKVVQDADRLDSLGAIGIARCLVLGGGLDRPLYDMVDPFCERRDPDDSVSTIDHFYTKLLLLRESMQTDSGRKEAARRTEFMVAYLRELALELGTSPVD